MSGTGFQPVSDPGDGSERPREKHALEARPTTTDRWAHRRGEPRVFVFAWTLFLFAATVSTFVAAQATGINDRSLVRGAARLLVLAATIGITVLWPMVRLSQSPDPRPVRGAARDLVVLLVPLQAMLWPQAMWWLAHWPLPVIGAVDLMVLAWGILVGGLLALLQAMRWRDQRSARQASRGRGALSMALIMAISILGAAPALIPGPEPLASPDVYNTGARLSWMFSPLTTTFEITRDQTWRGVTAAVTPAHIGVLIALALLGLSAWAVAARIQRTGRGFMGPAGLH